nr:LOG family protein [Flavipsychrobacter stenotrophus]
MIQTGKSKKFPVILIGKSYYLELYEYIQKMVYEKTISPR